MTTAMGVYLALGQANKFYDKNKVYVILFQPANGGVVMVNFYSLYINCAPNEQPTATLSQVAGRFTGQKSHYPPTR